MIKEMKIKKIILEILVGQIVFLSFAPFALAKADDLIINNDGSLELIITEPVLGEKTSVPAPTTSSSPPPSTPKIETPKAQTPTTAPKVVPVAPANSNTTVKISSTTTNDKKLNITIETTAKTSSATTVATPKAAPSAKPVATQGPGSSKPIPSPTSSPNTENIQTTQKTVDNVILRNAEKQPILTIQASNQSNEVNIQQKDINVTTNLPIQIDSKSHIVSVDTGNTTEKVSILPDQAVRGAADKITQSNLVTTNLNVSLVQDKGQAEYVVNQTKTGKLLGLINVSLPSQVKISAQTGKTISVWQSPLLYLAGFLIK